MNNWIINYNVSMGGLPMPSIDGGMEQDLQDAVQAAVEKVLKDRYGPLRGAIDLNGRCYNLDTARHDR